MSGERWLRWSRAWFDERTVESVIEPLVADWQHDAATTGMPRGLRTHLRWQIAVARTFFACFADSARKPLPAGVARTAWLAGALFSILGALLLTIPFGRGDGLFVEILLSGLGLGLPLSAVPLLVVVTRLKEVTPRRATWLGVRTAVVMSLVMVVLAGWMIPASNQQWRERLGFEKLGRSVQRGSRELTLVELFSPYTSPVVTEVARQREAQNRVALILMPLSLCALGVAASRRVRRPLGGALLWWIFAGALWLLVLPAANGLMRRTFLDLWVPWAPHLAMFIVIAILHRRRRESASPAHR